jgi:sucrose-6-phosphate hydrolase SacC (GH32 family)
MKEILMFSFLILIVRSSSADNSATEDFLKPRCHFIPASNWLNDPNGPFYDETTVTVLFVQYIFLM